MSDLVGVGIQSLSDVLGEGNDAGGEQVKNLADGVDPSDAATVGQTLGALRFVADASMIASSYALFLGVDVSVAAQPVAPFNYGPFRYAPTGFGQTGPGTIFAFNGASVLHVDTRNDEYDLNVSVFISNPDGSSSITLAGAAFANNHVEDDSAVIPNSGLVQTAVVGGDLSFNAALGIVDSIAGDFYTAQMLYQGVWD
jgi:hypothetical protein